jgi:GNAT superfamily N-acetyltransferase
MQFRVATIEDEAAIDVLMKVSAGELFPAYHGADKTPSAVRYIAVVDRTLLEDGTYFVFETAGTRDIVACGGWSRRDKLFTGAGEAPGGARLLDPKAEAARVRAMFVRSDWTRRGMGKRILDACEQAARAEGFRELSLMATLPGVPLYTAYGFEPLERQELRFPDGVCVDVIPMKKAIS